jgi:hypothetical protein
MTCLIYPIVLPADVMTVRYLEGVSRGFLIVKSGDGERIADGDVEQFAKGDRVTSHLIFRFKDGSIDEGTTVFSQRGTFRLLTDHALQKGPAFKADMESSIDTTTGNVTIHYTEGGKEKIVNERMKLPPDISNGMLFTLIKNIHPGVSKTTLSYLAVGPKPRIVKLEITSGGEELFVTGGSSHKAIHYVMKVDIGGTAGLIAPLIGKQPHDTQLWVLDGHAPTFVGSEGPLYADGPVWRIDLVSPVWSKRVAPDSR